MWTEAQVRMFADENLGRVVEAHGWYGNGLILRGPITGKVSSEHGGWALVVEEHRCDYITKPWTVKFTDGLPERAPMMPDPTGKCGAMTKNGKWQCTRPAGHPPTVHVPHYVDGTECGAGGNLRWPVDGAAQPTPAAPAPAAPAPTAAVKPAGVPEMTAEKVEAYKRAPLLVEPMGATIDPYTGLTLAQLAALREEDES